MTTAEDVRIELQDMDPERLRADFAAEGAPDFLWPLFQAGHWLGNKLEAAGATEQQRKGACFAFGQRGFTSIGREFDLAARVHDDWIEGRKDKPGRELADAILDEATHDRR